MQYSTSSFFFLCEVVAYCSSIGSVVPLIPQDMRNYFCVQFVSLNLVPLSVGVGKTEIINDSYSWFTVISSLAS